MKIKTSPSLLAADFLHLENEIRRAEDAGADMLHCDVMDGIYVPNISFGFDIISKISKITDLPLDVHMMTAAPQKYIDFLKKSGADSITLHTDVMPRDELIETLKYIASLGMKTAVSLRPKCPASDCFDFVPYCDMILVMTVEPGFGGQSFMEDMMPKVEATRNYIEKHGLTCEVEVDGGINPTTAVTAINAGANVLVAGSDVFKAANRAERIAQLRNAR